MNARICIIVSAILCLTAAPLFAGQRQAEVKKTEKKEFDLKAGGRIVLESNDGYIRIQSWNRDKVEVVMHKRAWARSEREAERLLDKIEIDISERSNALYLRDITEDFSDRNIGLLDLLRGDWDEGTVVDFELMVPERVNLELTVDDGDIRIAQIEGEIIIEADDGDITLEDCTANRVDISVDDGDVDIDNVRQADAGAKGLLFASVDDGNIFLRRSSFESIEFDGDDSEVVFRDVEVKYLDINLDDGDVEVDMDIRNEGRVRINLDDGDVDVDLKREIGASFNLSAYDGRIRTNFPVEVEDDDGSYWVRERTGDGGIVFRIEVDNGYITVNHR